MQRHRKDIDGLRAIAVLAVVAFHVGAPRAGGGFIGVDIFFVLSGFLITGILSAEADDRGTIRLGRFYTRRLRRLLPASTLTIVGTMVASVTLLSALSWKQVAETSAAAAVYASNLFFAREANDYFAADVQDNPLLHFWSLAVEEQFYIVWPLLILVLSRFGSAVRLAGLTSVAIASLFHSVILTDAASTWAYYSPLSRAWQFAAGGILALALPVGLSKLSTLHRELVAWSGFALIGGSLLLIDESTAFPGLAAVPTVVGTCLLIAAAVSEPSPTGRVLGSWPMQQLGALSYSWYLWHWPFLVIGQAALADTTPRTRILLALASLGVAALSYHLLERPVRFAPGLIAKQRPNWIMAGGLIVVVVVGAIAMNRWADDRLDSPELADLVTARDDVPELLGNDCNVADLDYLRATCTLGDPGASRTIVVLGDSHAEMWTPALGALADEYDVKITLHALGGCNVVGAPASIATSYCREVQGRTVDVVEGLDADAVIVSHFAQNISRIDPATWAAGVEAFIDEIEPTGAAIGWIHDGPILERDPVECVAANGEDECLARRSVVTTLPDRMRTAEAPVLEARSIAALDPLTFMCDADICPLRSLGLFRYRDNHHVSASYAEAVAPNFRRLLDELFAAPA